MVCFDFFSPSPSFTYSRRSLQFVVAAGLSLVSNLFIRAYHLSVDSKAAVLGVDRAKQGERQPNNLHPTHFIELSGPQDNNLRS